MQQTYKIYLLIFQTSSFWTTNLNEKSANLFKNGFDVESFCTLIHSAIPKAVEDGKFVEPGTDQFGYSDTQVPIAVAPPEGFVPTLKFPKSRLSKLKIPVMKVPKLRPYTEKRFRTPSIETYVPFTTLKDTEEESSAEKVEKFKKGLQKLLHIVKVLGQVDQYISERTRILVDKLSKTLAE